MFIFDPPYMRQAARKNRLLGHRAAGFCGSACSADHARQGAAGRTGFESHFHRRSGRVGDRFPDIVSWGGEFPRAAENRWWDLRILKYRSFATGVDADVGIRIRALRKPRGCFLYGCQNADGLSGRWTAGAFAMAPAAGVGFP